MASGIIKEGARIEQGTSNGWVYWKYADGHIEAIRTISTTITHYHYNNVYYGYYISDIATPLTMKDTSYYVGCDWSIGTGFSIPAGRLDITTTKFNAYAVSTASGSVHVDLRLHLVGFPA